MTDTVVTASEAPDEIEEEAQQPGAPPGVAYVAECAAHPGDGTAWPGTCVVNPDW